MKSKESFLSIILNWKHLSGYRNRNIIHEEESFVVTEYNIKASKELQNKTILFFSDTHFKGLPFPDIELVEVINSLNADWLICGGDLLSYLPFYDSGVNFLSRLEAKTSKIAVLGNWETRKLVWKSVEFWKKMFNDSGFHLLDNEVIDQESIKFVGLTHNRETRILQSMDKSCFNCVISHNPGSIIRQYSNKEILNLDLILSGHTHGGQFRIPFFGAAMTSSYYWKLFEYGLYQNDITNTKMIISGGLGYTWFNFRLFCKPEINLIRFCC